jgi:hypothetical protein
MAAAANLTLAARYIARSLGEIWRIRDFLVASAAAILRHLVTHGGNAPAGPASR